MTKDEALQMCLEYIETDKHERKYVRHAIKAALEQQAEPVGEVVEINNDGFRCEFNRRLAVGTKLYIAPPAAQRKPLTHDEIEVIGDKVANEKLVGPVANFRVRFARAIEAAHNIKEKTCLT